MPAFLPRIVLLASLVAAPYLASAAEEKVTFSVEGMNVVGTLNLPDGVKKPPVILLLHSFGGSRDEGIIPVVNEGIYARAARLWAEQGIASLRIDYRFDGDSDGAKTDGTLDTDVEDGLAALDFLARSGRVDANRMALVGWSMGGAIGAAVAGRTPHELDAVALWNPATNMGAAFPLLWGSEKIKEALHSGDTPVALAVPGGGEVKLKSAFFVSLMTLDAAAEITRYKGALLVAVGTDDDIVSPQPTLGKSFISYHPGEHELLVRPMDHAFNMTKDEKQIDELISTTATFVKKHIH
ncbi:alpha/beta hydrolase family protein [Pseudomonas sp. BIC9C]|uniref:alpha/beta hydrolase family protein n=1 Tax=Pseudomonas sp. BIC9C TaxID=3078458 RepID=UPI002AD44072|nr:alpha/beta fold hydrolase [Pseudomonas sp. BIC9C]